MNQTKVTREKSTKSMEHAGGSLCSMTAGVEVDQAAAERRVHDKDTLVAYKNFRLSSFRGKRSETQLATSLTMEGREPRFYTIRRGVEGCLALFRQAYSREEYTSDNEFMEQQEELLKKWADSVGAYGEKDNSLEYKLSSSPNVHYSALKATERLAGRLQHFLDRVGETLNEAEIEVPLPGNEDLVATQPNFEWDFDALRQSIKRAVARVIEHTEGIHKALQEE